MYDSRSHARGGGDRRTRSGVGFRGRAADDHDAAACAKSLSPSPGPRPKSAKANVGARANRPPPGGVRPQNLRRDVVQHERYLLYRMNSGDDRNSVFHSWGEPAWSSADRVVSLSVGRTVLK